MKDQASAQADGVNGPQVSYWLVGHRGGQNIYFSISGIIIATSASDQLVSFQNLLVTAVIMSRPSIGVAVFVFRSDKDNHILIGKRKGSLGAGVYSTIVQTL